MNERMQKIMESKQTARKRLMLLSFTEKIQILEKLRDRSLAIAQSSLRRKVADDNKPQ